LAKRKTKAQAPKTSGATIGYEAQRWQAANVLLPETDAAE
jgi:hypothetical protein